MRCHDENSLMGEETAQDRRKLLDQWRKAKAEEMKKTKLNQRPVFKVRHVETKEIYDRAGSRRCSSQNTTLQRAEPGTDQNRRVTRSQTKSNLDHRARNEIAK